jgi:3-hydroxyacyl-[acyl-carrier-protein] dehydratase
LTQLSITRSPDDTDQLFYLVKIDNARFSRMVVPGDQLDMEVVLKRTIRNMAQYDCVARVDGKDAASAMILCAESRS